MPIPESPILFIKPRNAISGPYPEPICIPAVAQDGTSDYEAEMAIVISKTGKNIAENDAMDYVLGFTCANDVSARKLQFANSQWCFSKGAPSNHLSNAQANSYFFFGQVLMDQLPSGQFSFPQHQSVTPKSSPSLQASIPRSSRILTQGEDTNLMRDADAPLFRT